MRQACALRSLTLAVGLSAATLMLGCDEVPTDVLADAPGPSLHHRPGHDGGPGGGGGGDDGGTATAETFDYTHSGSVTTDPATAEGSKNVGRGKESEDVVMDGGGEGEDLLIDGAFLADIDDGSCFPLAGGIFRVEFAGAIENTGETTTQSSFFFTAYASDGVSPIDYHLVVPGTHAAGAFPPAGGETVSIDLGAAEMGTQGKSKGACTGELGDPGSVDVTGTG